MTTCVRTISTTHQRKRPRPACSKSSLTMINMTCSCHLCSNQPVPRVVLLWLIPLAHANSAQTFRDKVFQKLPFKLFMCFSFFFVPNLILQELDGISCESSSARVDVFGSDLPWFRSSN